MKPVAMLHGRFGPPGKQIFNFWVFGIHFFVSKYRPINSKWIEWDKEQIKHFHAGKHSYIEMSIRIL
jgi:hypothetical protein